MGKCCGNDDVKIDPTDPCHPPQVSCGSKSLGGSVKAAGLGDGCTEDHRQASLDAATHPLSWFNNMIPNCLAYARDAKARGRRIVGIMCEYTPRELIMAADAVPVCLCGGSAETIGPAEEHLPANLCPLIKSTYGYHVKKANPFLEMADMVVAETTCDGKKKMYELMAETRPMHVLELPQKPDDGDAMTHWISELRKLKTRLEEAFSVTITDEKIRQSIRTMNRERSLRRRLAEMMKTDDSPLTGRQLLQYKSSISGICEDLAQYMRALDVYGAGGAGSCGDARPTKRKVRVLMTGVPMAHGAERVMEIIESYGGLVVCTDNCTGLKPILDDVDETAADPIVALAAKYFRLPCSVMTRNSRRLDVLRKLAKEYRAQCVIDLIWQACLTYDVESFFVRQLAEKELGIPYLRIETDYSPSDSARIALRVEALFETVQQRACRQE
jgi:benzoyl-CoA reductase/2-hydroxyglutaryl-CoA dehydratase subunit BcrC/BadD/HgdB